jgi:cold shock protein
MAQGVVIGFKDHHGYGFIRPDDGGGDVFVHARNITNADKLNQGQRVSFEVVTDDRRGKPRADRVRVICTVRTLIDNAKGEKAAGIVAPRQPGFTIFRC